MSIAIAYTLEEATLCLEDAKKALQYTLSGQAKRYKIGTREYEALSVDALKRMIEYYANIVEALSGKARTNRVARVVPRDL